MTDQPLNELEIPDGVHTADSAIEVMRAWVADGALHVIFDPETFGPEVGEWGRLLSDIGQHIAHAVALNGELSEREALTVIHEAFERGVLADSLSRSGRIKGRTSH